MCRFRISRSDTQMTGGTSTGEQLVEWGVSFSRELTREFLYIILYRAFELVQESIFTLDSFARAYQVEILYIEHSSRCRYKY